MISISKAEPTLVLKQRPGGARKWPIAGRISAPVPFSLDEKVIFMMTTFDHNYQNLFRFCFLIQICQSH